MQVLQQFVIAGAGRKPGGLRDFDGCEFTAQAKPHVMGLLEPAVVVDRPGEVTQPDQDAVLHLARLRDSVQQRGASRVLDQ